MRYIPKPPQSIAEEGFKAYLDRTRADHNDLGYKEFVERMELGLPKMAIARDFNIRNKNTIYKWIEIYNKEREES